MSEANASPTRSASATARSLKEAGSHQKMNFITRKHLPRRTFLRGLGTAVALPLLDAMIPARTALAQTAANPAPHLGFIYFPHGAIMDRWTPKTEGAGFEVPAILKPLESFKNHLTIVSHQRRAVELAILVIERNKLVDFGSLVLGQGSRLEGQNG